MSESEEELDTINWWLDFFADAGIPPNSAAQFAVNFSEHRIPKDREVINDLTNDEWKELGVELLGDRLSLKTFAKHGKKKKSKFKSVGKSSHRASSTRVAEVPVDNTDDEITKIISKAKEVATPIERQTVGNERVKSSNPFRKANQEIFDVDEDDDDAVYVSEATEVTDTTSINPVQFSVTLGGNRKRLAQSVTSVTAPKITRTFGSGMHEDVQENVVSSTAKVSVTLGKNLTVSHEPKGPKVTCSSFKPTPKSPSSQLRSISARLGTSDTSAKSRLGNRSVKARLGNL